MSYNVQILCSKYTWDNNVKVKDCNFFSNETPIQLDSGIDLYNNLIKDSLGDICFAKENTDTQGNLFYESGGFSLRISDIALLDNGNISREYFNLFAPNKRIKFRILLYIDNSLAFHGLLGSEDIKEKFALKSGDKEIELSVKGFEKEFKEYFSSAMLPDYDAPNWITENYFGSGTPNLKYVLLKDLIELIFNNKVTVNLMFQNPEWYRIWRISYIYADLYDSIYIKSGYLNFVVQGIKVWDFFKELLQSWGWTFALNYVNNPIKPELIIKDRASANTELALTTINYSEFIQHSVGNTSTKLYDIIKINCGEYYGGDGVLGNNVSQSSYHGLRGKRAVVIGDTTDSRLHPVMYMFFDDMHRSSITPFYWFNYSNGHYVLDIPENYDGDFAILIVADNVLKYYMWSGSSYINKIEITYNVDKQLKIDQITPSRAMLIKMLYPRQNISGYQENGMIWGSYSELIGVCGHNDMIICGGVADCITYNSQYHNYDKYIYTEQFKYNMMSFISTSKNSNEEEDLLIIEPEIKGLITNPYQRIKIENYKYSDLSNKEFAILDLRYNIFENKTKLKLQKV